MEYGARSPRSGGIVGDETEDLYALLKTVLVRPSSSRRPVLFTRFRRQGPPSRHTGSRRRCHPLKLSTSARRTRVSAALPSCHESVFAVTFQDPVVFP